MFFLKKYNLIIIFAFFLSLFIFNTVFAFAADPAGIKNWSDSLDKGAQIEKDDPYYIAPKDGDTRAAVVKKISGIIGWGAFFGFMLIVRIVWAGYLWMTARGNTEQVEDAKKTITHATIGIVIFASLYIIAYFLLGQLSNVTKYETGFQ